MSDNNKEPYTLNISREVIEEFEEVAERISTEEEPFDKNEWLEAKMEQFSRTQKKSLAWGDYAYGK